MILKAVKVILVKAVKKEVLKKDLKIQVNPKKVLKKESTVINHLQAIHLQAIHQVAAIAVQRVPKVKYFIIQRIVKDTIFYG